jgi:hypothetical protein
MNIPKGYFRVAWVLSIFVGIIISLCYGLYFNASEIDVNLPENWKRMSFQEKLDNLDEVLSKDGPFFLISKIKQLKIRRQLKKMIVDKEDEILREGSHYSFSFRCYMGWEELGLLGLVGFISIWMIYGLARGVAFMIPYAYAPLKHFPSLPPNEGVESLPFPILSEPAGFDSARETAIVLAPEERPKRPRKPQAVWIE